MDNVIINDDGDDDDDANDDDDGDNDEDNDEDCVDVIDGFVDLMMVMLCDDLFPLKIFFYGSWAL